MNDKNLVNKPVKAEQIIEALRCASAPGGPIGYFGKCPFWKKENLTPEQAEQLGTDEWVSCDIDRIGLEAADRLANDQTHIAALQQEIEKLRSGRQWVPVTERLPEPEVEVLLVAKGWGNKMLYIGYLHPIKPEKSWLTGIESKGSEWAIWGWSYLREPIVTHWMPLPKAPEVE